MPRPITHTLPPRFAAGRSSQRLGDLVRLGVAWALTVASVAGLLAIALSPAWER